MLGACQGIRDENTVAEVAPILGFLRDIQRRFQAAVLLVHHARKSGATRPGQALRRSSELHAWGDSNLYLRRRDRQIFMIVEEPFEFPIRQRDAVQGFELLPEIGFECGPVANVGAVAVLEVT